MRKCSVLSLVVVSALSMLLVPMTRGADSSSLIDRLHTADTESALDAVDAKPWHLKIAVQTFDEKGKLADQGIIEEWWAGPGMDRREYRTTSYTATEIWKNGSLYRTDKASAPPYYLDLARRQIVHPLPQGENIADSSPELRPTPFGKTVLDCIMLTQPIKDAREIPLGLFPTYCFDTAKTSLRAAFEFGGQLIVRNGIGKFAGKTVATDIVISVDRVQMATAKVLTLETSDIPDSKFAPDDATVEQKAGLAKLAGGVMAGKLVTMINPVYPASAKANRTMGIVILHALIGTDGHVHSLSVASASSPDLVISAIAAVRRWVYTPYLLNGVPTDVETTITVNFTF